jgi:hypothetical protein
MKRALVAAGCVLIACVALIEPVRADTVQLQVSKTANPGEVRLSWSGGIPSYTIYRSDVAATVVDPGNQVSVTDDLEYFDTPPGSIAFFFVETPCTAVPPDVCCLNDGYCLGTEFCDFNTSLCTTKRDQGASCVGPNECQSDFCVDGVCCTDLCSGTCSACNLAPPGTCGAIPDGTDPAAECPGVSCAGFFYGFVGDTCFPKADVPAAQATCNGAGACRTTGQECTAQTSQGPGTITCNALCQDPTPGTCTGTIPGQCTNVNPGTQTCGVGACQRTVNQCVNGAPNTCVPNPPTAETCNDIDDNCDGTVDNGAFNDALEPNAACPGATLTQATDLSGPRTVSPTLYPSGDVDVFTIPVAQVAPGCDCCEETCDTETFGFTVSLTVPVGAGSYEVCLDPAGPVCLAQWTNCTTVTAGSSGTESLNFVGSCFDADTSQFYVRVRGIGAPGFECRTYTLQYSFSVAFCPQ